MNDNPTTPEEVGAWLRAHGGPVRSEGPDANGVITQHAADGSYLRQVATPGGGTRVLEVKPAGPASAPSDQPPASAPAGSGSGMQQAEMDARLSAIGGAQHLTHTPIYQRRTVKVLRPDAFGDMTPQDVDVNVQRWVNEQTGHVLEAYQSPDGSWTVVKDDPKGVTPRTPGQGQTPGDAIPRIEGTPMGRDANGQTIYDNEQPIMVWRRPDGTIVDVKPLTADQRRQWQDDREKSRNPGGKTDKQLEDERKDAEARAARPGTKISERTVVEGGKKITIETWRLPDGKTEERRAEAPASAAERPGRKEEPYQHEDGKTYTRIVETDPATNQTRTYFVDPATGKEVTLPPKGVGNIPGLPTYVPDLTKPGAGLFEYAKQLDEFMKANPSFTWEKRQQVLEAAQKQASTVVQEFNIGASVLREQYQTSVTQRGQDMTQANNRAALANTHHQNAIGLIEKFAPYLGVTPGDAGKLFLGMMASQLATATAYGGMQNYGREEMDPRLLSFADRAVGGASRPVSPTPPGTPPNALGLGGPGAMFTPQGSPPAPAPNPDAAMAEAVRQQRAASGAPLPAPLLGPQPAVAAGGGVQAPAMAAPPAAPASNVGQIGDPMTQPPAINPITGEPTGLAPLPGQAGFAERDDDILTVEETPTGRIIRISRAQYQEQLRNYPHAGQVTRIVKVEPSSAAQPGDLTTRGDVDRFVPPPEPVMPNPATQSMVPPGLEAMFANVLPPEPVSWHERAQAQASAFEMPSAANVARGEALFGRAVPTGPMFSTFDIGGAVGPAPLPMTSRIPGITPEIDRLAREQLAAEMQGMA